MFDEKLFGDFLALCDRIGLSDTEAAVLTKLSPHTVRVCRLTRRPPRTDRCRRQIVDFVSRNRAAQTRGELRFAE